MSEQEHRYFLLGVLAATTVYREQKRTMMKSRNQRAYERLKRKAEGLGVPVSALWTPGRHASRHASKRLNCHA